MTVPLSRRETPHRPTTTLIADHFRENAAYETWRAHGTPDYLLMFTREGSGRIGFADGGGALVTRPGDAVLIAPHTLHDYGTSGTLWDFVWAHFPPLPHWSVGLLAWPEAAPGVGVLSLPAPEPRASVDAALREMYRWFVSGGLPRREEFARNALERALLWCDSVNPRRAEPQIDPRIRRAMSYLSEHLREPVSLAELAAHAGLSPSRLGHLFREQVGRTPQQYAEAARMDRARQLLSLTGRTVASVAEEVGFASPFYFTLRFRKATGLSPTEWRHAAEIIPATKVPSTRSDGSS